MTHLRKMMLEELQRRHYSEATTQRYIRFIERFAQHFQTTATTGPAITPEEIGERYAVNALGVASNVTFSKRKVNLEAKFFEEFANRSTSKATHCSFPAR